MVLFLHKQTNRYLQVASLLLQNKVKNQTVFQIVIGDKGFITLTDEEIDKELMVVDENAGDLRNNI